jgi:hypothetical protein
MSQSATDAMIQRHFAENTTAANEIITVLRRRNATVDEQGAACCAGRRCLAARLALYAG